MMSFMKRLHDHLPLTVVCMLAAIVSGGMRYYHAASKQNSTCMFQDGLCTVDTPDENGDNDELASPIVGKGDLQSGPATVTGQGTVV
jgi:hypothetical protein